MDSTLGASMKGELSRESLMWINNQGRRQQPVLPQRQRRRRVPTALT